MPRWYSKRRSQQVCEQHNATVVNGPQIDLSLLGHRSIDEQTLWNALIVRTRATDRSIVMQPPVPRVQFDRSAFPTIDPGPRDPPAMRIDCTDPSKLRRLTVNLAFHRVNWITEFASYLHRRIYILPLLFNPSRNPIDATYLFAN